MSSSTKYEDNDVPIIVVKIERMTPTPTHIYVKYHWFREHDRKEIMIRKIESENQKVDILTKGLQGELLGSCYEVGNP